MKRVLLIAAILEGLKYAFAGLLFNLPESFFTLVFAIIFYTWFLPEMMISAEQGPHHWYTRLGRLAIGIAWNLPAALYISRCFLDTEVESRKKRNQSESTVE